MGSFSPGKIFIEELGVPGTMTGRHSLQGESQTKNGISVQDYLTLLSTLAWQYYYV